MSITGLGPHGERAAPTQRVSLTSGDIDAARNRRFSVAVVLHTTDSDWSRQQIAGVASALEVCGAAIAEIVDCRFDAEAQIEALERAGDGAADAVISIPVANTAVADAHRKIAHMGKPLILSDNVPTGLLPSRDYTSLVSADNFGLGLISAEILSPHIAANQEVGILAYGVDFYATNQREIAFGRWMKAHRPDLKVVTKRFRTIESAGADAIALLTEHQRLAGLFVVWDTPALVALEALRANGPTLPMATVDLGHEAAVKLAQGDVVGVAAQQPFEQGATAAQVAVMALLERPVPSWVALPGLPVTRANIVELYRKVWSADAPSEVVAALAN